jgi:hypothetical protein
MNRFVALIRQLGERPPRYGAQIAAAPVPAALPEMPPGLPVSGRRPRAVWSLAELEQATVMQNWWLPETADWKIGSPSRSGILQSRRYR